jgi:hypothetical protein
MRHFESLLGIVLHFRLVTSPSEHAKQVLGHDARCPFRRTGAKGQGLAWVPGKLSGWARCGAITFVIDGLFQKWNMLDLTHSVIIAAVVVCSCLMPPFPSPLPPNMITIDSIRTLSSANLKALLDTHIPVPQQPTPEFLDSLPSDERSITLKLCLC